MAGNTLAQQFGIHGDPRRSATPAAVRDDGIPCRTGYKYYSDAGKVTFNGANIRLSRVRVARNHCEIRAGLTMCGIIVEGFVCHRRAGSRRGSGIGAAVDSGAGPIADITRRKQPLGVQMGRRKAEQRRCKEKSKP